MTIELPELPDDEASAVEFYKDQVTGKYRSNWGFLRVASASSYLKAMSAFSSITRNWARMIDGGKSEAEAAILLELNYGLHVLGTVLSATVTPAFALEAFLRYSAEITLRMQSAGPDALALALNGYDRLSAHERLSATLRMTGAAQLDPALSTRLDALIQFRNATLHDTPYLYTPTGHLVHAKGGKVNVLREDRLFHGLYPLVGDDAMALTLRHARTAVDTHDELAEHVLATASSDFRTEFEAQLSPGSSPAGPIKMLGGNYWELADQVADSWESVVMPRLKSVTLGQRKDAMLDAARKLRVKIVDEET